MLSPLRRTLTVESDPENYPLVPVAVGDRTEMHYIWKELRIHGPVPAPVAGLKNSPTSSYPKSLRSSTSHLTQTVHSFVKN
jgi:hypothetical protein